SSPRRRVSRSMADAGAARARGARAARKSCLSMPKVSGRRRGPAGSAGAGEQGGGARGGGRLDPEDVRAEAEAGDAGGVGRGDFLGGEATFGADEQGGGLAQERGRGAACGVGEQGAGEGQSFGDRERGADLE